MHRALREKPQFEESPPRAPTAAAAAAAAVAVVVVAVVVLVEVVHAPTIERIAQGTPVWHKIKTNIFITHPIPVA